jgi:hypothetical protein
MKSLFLLACCAFAAAFLKLLVFAHIWSTDRRA